MGNRGECALGTTNGRKGPFLSECGKKEVVNGEARELLYVQSSAPRMGAGQKEEDAAAAKTDSSLSLLFPFPLLVRSWYTHFLHLAPAPPPGKKFTSLHK